MQEIYKTLSLKEAVWCQAADKNPRVTPEWLNTDLLSETEGRQGIPGNR